MIYALYPVFKDYLWGGTRLRDEYGKKSDLQKVAESWELACHKDGTCFIGLAGIDPSNPVPLTEFIRMRGKTGVLGTKPAAFPSFPVMIKLIDAKDHLSVQVHPDDRYARRVEGSVGKTEMWYIVDCEEGAELLYGFNRAVTREEVEAAALNDTLPELANHVPVHKGDVFWINAGTLHAIGKGILIAEMENPWTLSSERVMISSPVYEWERQWINPDGSRSAYPIYVNENPEPIVSPDGKNVVVVYSASGIWTEFNQLGMLYAPADSDLLDPAQWHKLPEPQFVPEEESGLFGTSNVSVIPGVAPDGSQKMVYQAKYYKPDGERIYDIRLKDITWDDASLPVFGNP